MNELESNSTKGNANSAGNDNSKKPLSIPGGENKKITDPDKNKTDKKQKNWPNRIQATASIILIIITGTYTFYAREQVIETRKAVKIAEDSNKVGVDSIKNTLAEMRKQSKAMQTAADANKKAAELANRSIKNTQDQFSLDQRAWIKIKSVESREPLQSGKNVHVKFTLNNTGKTPALRVSYNYKIWEEVDGKTIIKMEGIDSKEFYYGPGDERYITMTTNDAMLQREIDDIYSGKVKFLMDISITYFDIYKTNKTRHTHMCYQYTPHLKVFAFGNRCSYMD